MESKLCKDCGLFKPINCFYLLRKGGKYYQSYCRPCSAERGVPARRKYKKRVGNDNQDKHRRSVHGRAAILFRSAKGRANSKHLPFTLTPQRVLSAIEKGVCEVTGIEFDMSIGGGRKPFAPSIDRKELVKGYTDSNVQVVVWIHNTARSDWGNATLKKYIRSFFRK